MAEPLLNRWLRLKAEAKQHKAAIRRHREQLGAVMADLDEVARDCRRMGIALIDMDAPASPTTKAS